MAQWAVFLFALATSAAQKIHFNAGGPALETADRNFLPLACGDGAWSESARHPLVGPRNVPLEAYTTRCVGNKLLFSIPLPESLRGRPLRVTVKSSDSGFQPATWLWETFKQARHWEQSVVSVHIRGEKSTSHHGAPLKAGEIQSLFRVRVPPTNAEFVDLEIESKGAPAFVNSIQVQLSDSHDAFSWSHDTQIRSAPSASSIFREFLLPQEMAPVWLAFFGLMLKALITARQHPLPRSILRCMATDFGMVALGCLIIAGLFLFIRAFPPTKWLSGSLSTLQVVRMVFPGLLALANLEFLYRKVGILSGWEDILLLEMADSSLLQDFDLHRRVLLLEEEIAHVDPDRHSNLQLIHEGLIPTLSWLVIASRKKGVRLCQWSDVQIEVLKSTRQEFDGVVESFIKLADATMCAVRLKSRRMSDSNVSYILNLFHRQSGVRIGCVRFDELAPCETLRKLLNLRVGYARHAMHIPGLSIDQVLDSEPGSGLDQVFAAADLLPSGPGLVRTMSEQLYQSPNTENFLVTAEIAKELDPCTICGQHFEEDHGATRLPCGHVFHLSACLSTYLRCSPEDQKTCPNCRQAIDLSQGAAALPPPMPPSTVMPVCKRRDCLTRT